MRKNTVGMTALGVLACWLSFGRDVAAVAHVGVLRYNTSGNLDTSFNGTGKVQGTAAGGDYFGDLQIDSSGRIVVCATYKDTNGDWGLVVGRYTASGAADTTFGWLGATTLGIPISFLTFNGCAIDTNGKIVVGYWNTSFDTYLSRFNSNGSLDTTYGFAGYAPLTTLVSAEDIVAISGGKVLVAGAKPNDLGVTRVQSNGAIDTTFGVNGVATADFGNDHAYRLAVDALGRIVVTGICYIPSPSGPGTMCAARFTANGATDNTFDTDGKVTVSFPSSIETLGSSVVTDSSKRPILVGTLIKSDHSQAFALARLTELGALDTTFNGTGRQTISFGTGNSAAGDVVLTSGGKIMIAGGLDSGTSSQYAAARLTTTGALDTTFSGDGKQTTSFTNFLDAADGIRLDSSGRAVIGGNTSPN